MTEKDRIESHESYKSSSPSDFKREYLQERIDRILSDKKVPHEARKMMGGLCYMVDDKMCFGIVNSDLMARVGTEQYPSKY